MQYTLEELAAAVGCEAYPPHWNEFFADAMADYDANGCPCSTAAFYDRLEREYTEVMDFQALNDYTDIVIDEMFSIFSH